MNIFRKIANGILGFEEKIFGIRTPSDWVKVDNVFIVEKLIEEYPLAKLFISDSEYYICPLESINDFLAMDETDKETYVSETFDCDDFSFRLMGQFHVKPYSALAIGIAWSMEHAYNIVVTTEGVYLIEPQSDEVMPPLADAVYATELIIM